MKQIVPLILLANIIIVGSGIGFAYPNRITNGPIAVQYAGGSGLSVWYNGVPVIVGSGVQAYAPRWKEGYYSSYYGTTPSVSVSENQITAVFHSSRYGFSGTETYQLQGQTLNMQLHVTWTDPKPALMELNLGLIWSPSFIGLPIQVQGSQAAAEKVVPVVTRSTYNNPDRLAGNFSELSLTGRVCNFTLTSPNTANGSVLLDGRHTQRGWSDNSPNFWLGMLGVPLPQNQTVNFAATFRFTPGAAAQAPTPPVLLTLSPSKQPIYRLPERPVIIPKPKQLHWLKRPLLLNHPQAVTYELEGPAQDTMPALHSLRWWLKRLAGIKLVPSDLNPMIRLRLKRSAGHGRPGGYDLSVNEHEAIITGHDAAGLYYGAQTLIELLTSKQDLPALAGCHISDWPTFPFRGAHLFVGSDARPFEDRLIQRILSHLKMNQLVLECEYTKWA
ncbi:MAG: glycoside hydrolase family 20 zincin-like fold domain-containing protein, partial [Armatimonadetes bacterium]|nr:glycoside hydrolase family 20 zincin-like fold domain-containing protein [Armatimonadota bacterium]